MGTNRFVWAFDEKGIPTTAMSICSVWRHHANPELHCIVPEGLDIARFPFICKNFHWHQVRRPNVREVFSKHHHWTDGQFLKFRIKEVLGTGKVLYLDHDIICGAKTPDWFWESNGTVRGVRYLDKFPSTNFTTRFNAGVMLFDLDRITNQFDQCIDHINNKGCPGYGDEVIVHSKFWRTADHITDLRLNFLMWRFSSPVPESNPWRPTPEMVETVKSWRTNGEIVFHHFAGGYHKFSKSEHAREVVHSNVLKELMIGEMR